MVRVNLYALWTWTVLLVTCAAPARAASPIDFSLDWTHYGETSTVQFRAWIPDELDRVKGIMLALPGSGGDIRNITTNRTWQTRLPAMEFGLVGARDVLDTIYWGATAAEMQSNIQNMLDALATEYSRPEISNAPIFPFGHSKGAFAASSIVQGTPERTLGFFSDKTFTEAGYIVGSAVAAVPGLAVAGTGDEYIPEEYARSTFDSWRSQGAEVGLVVEGGGHNQTRPDLRFAFIDEVLKRRYPQGQVPSIEPGNPLVLNTINESDGWLADSSPLDGDEFTPMEWPKIAPTHEYTGDPTTACWLPSETMAMVYRAHTHRPVGIDSNALSIFASDDGIEEVQYVVSVDFDGVVYENVDIYHANQLIAHLGYTPDTLRVPFTPTTIGNHTFIAVAEYLYEGQTHYTSAYSTFFVPVLPAAVPEPASILLLLIGVLASRLMRRR
jgi:predicted esterase